MCEKCVPVSNQKHHSLLFAAGTLKHCLLRTVYYSAVVGYKYLYQYKSKSNDSFEQEAKRHVLNCHCWWIQQLVRHDKKCGEDRAEKQRSSGNCHTVSTVIKSKTERKQKKREKKTERKKERRNKRNLMSSDVSCVLQPANKNRGNTTQCVKRSSLYHDDCGPDAAPIYFLLRKILNVGLVFFYCVERV